MQNVEIYRNEAGDLVLHPLAPNRMKFLLKALFVLMMNLLTLWKIFC